MKPRPTHFEPDGAGLYLHVPYCRSKCHYCAFHSIPLRDQDTRPLVRAMLTELATYTTTEVTTAYLGGGSPTVLPPADLHRLLRGITEACPHLEELTVECNPGQVTTATLQPLLRLGVNRLSFGIQSFDARELQILGRSHGPSAARQAIRAAQSLNCPSISLDLIFAIPGSDLEAWDRTLSAALRLDVSHLSAYSLGYEAGTPLDDYRRRGTITAVDEETDRAMYERAIERLTAAGYEHYEISNFARPGHACRHNLGYWHNRPFLGIGPGAASDWQGMRRQNLLDIEAYYQAIHAGRRPWAETVCPPAADRLCETAVLGLRTVRGLDLGRFARQTGTDFWSTFGGVAQRHIQEGFLAHRDNRICLTPQALPIADTVLCDFAAF